MKSIEWSCIKILLQSGSLIDDNIYPPYVQFTHLPDHTNEFRPTFNITRKNIVSHSDTIIDVYEYRRFKARLIHNHYGFNNCPFRLYRNIILFDHLKLDEYM